MAPRGFAHRLLHQEAQALLTRLEHVRPYSVVLPMVPAAGVSSRALVAIEEHMAARRYHLNRLVRGFLLWLDGPGAQRPAADVQRRFTVLRMRFNSVLTQFDIFADACTQRAEHGTGVWVAGLDVLAEDALSTPGFYDAPPVICYVDRGHGAAIRRARTRLPGGDSNPVAVIQVPRERLVGSGIASSLIHEVGHQAASLLDLVPSLLEQLAAVTARATDATRLGWRLLSRWISEIVADFWSVAKVGVTATLGLLAVVSLPRAFVFRVDEEDPHPTPWIRVKLSCAMGRVLYPDHQWDVVERAWEALYPFQSAPDAVRPALKTVAGLLPAFAQLIAGHVNGKTRGRPLGAVAASPMSSPARLRALGEQARNNWTAIDNLRPTVAVATLGQQRFSGRMAPRAEGQLLQRLLSRWAIRSTLGLGPTPRASAAFEAA